MSATLHWGLKKYMREFRDGGDGAHRDARLPVLLALVLHANPRGRCWPSTTVLCEETGFAKPAVVEARKWLIARKAIELVSYDKRVGLEAKLPRRQYVYQMTGVIETSTGMQPYLVMSPETEHDAVEESTESNPSIPSEDEGNAGVPSDGNESNVPVLLAEPEGKPDESSPSELSLAVPKVLPESKGISSFQHVPDDSSSSPESPVRGQELPASPNEEEDGDSVVVALAKQFPFCWLVNREFILALAPETAAALMLQAKRDARQGDGSGLLGEMIKRGQEPEQLALRLAPIALETGSLDWTECDREARLCEYEQLAAATREIAGMGNAGGPEDDPEPDGLDQTLGPGEWTPAQVWAAAKGQLSLQLNRSTFDSWVRAVNVRRYSEGVLTLRAPNATVRDYFDKQLRASVEHAVRMAAELAELKIEVVA